MFPCAYEQSVALLAAMIIVYIGHNLYRRGGGGGGLSLISNACIKFGSNRLTNDLIISSTVPKGRVAAILSAV